jgi:hypothetical protein
MSTRRRRRLKTNFSAYLDANFPGLIRWPLQEVSGDVALARNFGVTGLTDSSQYPGPQLLVDGDMEAETTVAWTPNSDATLTKETASPYTGTRYLRVQSTGGDSASQARQDVLTAGVRAIVDGWYRTESGGTAQVIIGLGGANALPEAADWTYFSFEGIPADALCMFGAQGVDKYAEFDDVRAREANPLNGDNNGATVGQPFGGNIPYAYSFDGNNDYIQLPAAALSSVLDGGEFTLGAFVNPSDWAVSNLRVLVRLFIDANNQFDIRKGTANRFTFTYTAGGTASGANYTDSTLADQNIFVAMTISKSTGASGEKRNFVNGAQVSLQTGLGTWAGGSLVENQTLIGGLFTTSSFWLNLATTVFLHPTRAMTATEITEIYVRSGI